jgi:nitroreductase
MTEHAMPDAAPDTPDLFEIMRTTRSMRRLKPDPVPNELIRKILEAGVCAPSGGNMQRWRFVVIRDPQIKQTVGAYYKRAWDEQVAPRYRAGEPAPGMSRERFLRLLDAAEFLAAHIHEAPVWIVPCLEGAAPTRTSGSSIYPAVQNMLLAARALGLGATLTTLICSSRRKQRPHSDCRPVSTHMPCCRSATLWAGSGQSAASLSQMSSMKIGGASLTGIRVGQSIA